MKMAEVLVVTSKIKKQIRKEAGMSTSKDAINKLSEVVESICKGAIEKAKEDGRKTVIDRDIAAVVGH